MHLWRFWRQGTLKVDDDKSDEQAGATLLQNPFSTDTDIVMTRFVL